MTCISTLNSSRVKSFESQLKVVCSSFTFIRADRSFFYFPTCQGFPATPAALQCGMASWHSQQSSTKLCQNKQGLTPRRPFSSVFLASPRWGKYRPVLMKVRSPLWRPCRANGRANGLSCGYRLCLIAGSSFIVPPRSSFDSLSTEGVLHSWTR